MSDDQSRIHLAARGIQSVIVVVIAYSTVVGDYDLVVNGILALALTFVPLLIEYRYSHEVDERLTLWIAVAALLHTIGFLGPYSIQSGPLSYYDQLAHATSASLVAGIGYAFLEAIDSKSSRVRFPEEFRALFTLLFILAFGVTWEIVEFGAGTLSSSVLGQEILVQYGMDDIVFDLVFNTLGAAIVALWGTGYFDGIAALFSRRLPRIREP